MKIKVLILFVTATLISFFARAESAHSEQHAAPAVDAATAAPAHAVPAAAGSGNVIAMQRHKLDENTLGKGFGPQSPRNIDSKLGNNAVSFAAAPPYQQMNLCNIHFHKNAEHKGGEFSKYAGDGDGHGYQSGYVFSGQLMPGELQTMGAEVCPSKHGGLLPGDTIEVHYVHSSAQVQPGPTLEACLNESIKNPQLRVETQVYVLVNDRNARDFGELTRLDMQNGLHQALNIPADTGKPIEYAGSTTGPGYNEKGSPFQVTWSVRPKIEKVNLESVGDWCKSNVFNEDHAHGVRNLVTNPALLSRIIR